MRPALYSRRAGGTSTGRLIRNAANLGKMAVYTDVPDDELRAFVAHYAIGEAVSCKGIAEGVENSNYLLRTERGNYILTLYEKRVDPADLPFFLALLDHLAGKGVACPTPMHGKDGKALRQLCGRPAAIVSFLDGMWPRRIERAALRAARRRVGAAAPRRRRFPAEARPTRCRSPAGAGSTNPARARADEVAPGLARGARRRNSAILDPALAERPARRRDPCRSLPRQCVLPRRPEVSGLIDFYFACNDFLAYDIAICLNAWCFEADGSFNVTKARLLLRNYRAARALIARTKWRRCRCWRAAARCAFC